MYTYSVLVVEFGGATHTFYTEAANAKEARRNAKAAHPQAERLESVKRHGAAATAAEPAEPPQDDQAPAATDTQPAAVAQYAGPKHYWKALGRDAGLAVAKRLKVPAEADNRTMTVALSGDRAEAAAALLADVWTAAMAQFKEAGGLKGQWPDLPHAEAYAKAQAWLTARALVIAKEAAK